MGSSTILPDKENFRRALKWISGQGEFSLKVVEEASVRFDLSPTDEEFLTRHFTEQKEN